MRITYLLTSKVFSGAENVVYYLVKNISEISDVQVQLIINDELEEYYTDLGKKKNVIIYSYGKHFFRPKSNPKLFLSKIYKKIFSIRKPHLYKFKKPIISQLEEFKPHIIHIHMYKTLEIYLVLLNYIKKKNIKSFYTWHGNRITKYHKEIINKKPFDFYTAVSKSAKKVYSGYFNKEIKKIYNGVEIDLSYFNSLPKKENSDKVIILFPGGQRENKGYKHILKLNDFLENNSNMNYELRICGGEKLKNKSNLKYLGRLNHRDYLKELYNSEVLLRPAKEDTFAISILEGLIFNKLIICGDLDVYKEVYGLRNNIEYVDLDYNKFNSSVKDIIENRNDLFKEKLINYKLYNEFSWSTISMLYYEFYKEKLKF